MFKRNITHTIFLFDKSLQGLLTNVSSSSVSIQNYYILFLNMEIYLNSVEINDDDGNF